MPDDPSSRTPFSGDFESVLAGILREEEEGRAIDVERYCRSFPDLAEPLRDFFRNREHFARLAPLLAPTPAQQRADPEEETGQTSSSPNGPTTGGRLGPGSRFDTYEVLQEAGRGGRGVVYQVNDLELNRPLAVKVLRPELRDEADAARRFLEEAQVVAQLQHPGIVPIHAIGRLPDGRPYFAMKLIQGRTLAELLAERTAAGHDLPRFLAIFHQVCQAVAYAHSRGVVHRDLKPANVMVGAFAEVQVMDWGLAKVRCLEAEDRPAPRDEPGVAARGGRDTLRTVRTEVAGLASVDGLVLGTIPYMAPEQARGEVEQVDARADVFGLGAVLCEVLTGQPPYTAATAWKLQLMAATGDLAAALERLDSCGADADLIALARSCLSPQRESRPHDAAAVAERMAAYLAEVQERLRKAEIDKAAAQARAEAARATVRAERRARRLTVGLAAATLAVVAALAGGGLWLQRQRAALRQEIGVTRDQAVRFRQAGHFEEGRELLEEARNRLGASGPADLRAQVDQALADTRLVERLDSARQRALTAVEGDKPDWAGTERDYAATLREAGLGEDGEDAEVVAARVRASAVREELVAALDDWASITGDRSRHEWLLAVARAADPDPGRDRLRQPALWWDKAALARTAREVRAAEQSPQLVTALARAPAWRGRDGRDAVALLREALARHPSDFWLNSTLGDALIFAKEWDEAISYYRAALALRPRAGFIHNDLANALKARGRLDEAIRHYEEALRLDPNNAVAHHNFGNALRDKGRLDEAIRHYQEVVRLLPRRALAYHSLGAVLYEKGQVDEAIRHFQKALAIDSKQAAFHFSLGLAREHQGNWDEAQRGYEKAIDLDPDFPQAHNNLGTALALKGRLDEAIDHWKEAFRLDPRYALARRNLLTALMSQRRLDEAIEHCQKVLDLDPRSADSHTDLAHVLEARGRLDAAILHYEWAVRLDPKNGKLPHNLGLALEARGRTDEAMEQYQKAIDLDPSLAEPHFSLGNVLRARGQLDKAMEHWKKAIDIDPKHAPAYGNLGSALYERNQVEEAIKHWKKAIAIDRTYPQPYAALGDALLTLGRLAEAREATLRCLDLLPLQHPMRAAVERQRQRCEEALRKRAAETK